MRRLGNWLPWVLAAAVGMFAAVNWATLSRPAPIDLMVARVEAPLGLVLLGLTALLFAVFVVASLRTQVHGLLETRRLLKEIQRVQGLADEAEASRVGDLGRLVESEFRRLHERLDARLPDERIAAREG